jgi:small-conductance mechanosensitive channel
MHFDLSDPAQAAIAAAIVVLAALVAHALGRRIVLRLVRARPMWREVAQRIDPPIGLLLPLLALQALGQALPERLPGLSGLLHLNGVLLIVALTWMAVGALGGVAAAILARHPVDVADNLQARRIHTQTRVLSRVAMSVAVVIGAAFVLMTFPGARQIGANLLASAGVVSVIVGLAARSVFSNLLAGLQIALAQPIRIDDVLVVEGEWGRVEEITATYVVLRIWDQRRLIIPLQWLIEHPFQNWTRTDAGIIGTVLLWVDLGTPLEALRAEAQRLCEISEHWDGRLCKLQVVEASERAMQLRVLVTSASSGQNWDLRCEVREGLLAFVQAQQPAAVPRLRTEWKEAPVPRRRRIDAERAALSEA